MRTHTEEGTNSPLIIGALRSEGQATDERLSSAERRVAKLLQDARLETRVAKDIAGVQWTKLMMNLNNALDALSELSIKPGLQSEAHRWTLASCQEEALRVLEANGIKVESVGLFIPHLMPHLLRMPNWLYSTITPLRITDEARGSMVHAYLLKMGGFLSLTLDAVARSGCWATHRS